MNLSTFHKGIMLWLLLLFCVSGMAEGPTSLPCNETCEHSLRAASDDDSSSWFLFAELSKPHATGAVIADSRLLARVCCSLPERLLPGAESDFLFSMSRRLRLAYLSHPFHSYRHCRGKRKLSTAPIRMENPDERYVLIIERFLC